jgi:hypothetical protein
VEISVKANEESRVAAENAPNSLLKVELSCTLEDSRKYTYYRISNIVGGTLYADEAQQKPIIEYSIIDSSGTMTTLWFDPNLYTGTVPSFTVEQISMTGEVGGSVTMTLNLLNPQPRGQVAGV